VSQEPDYYCGAQYNSKFSFEATYSDAGNIPEYEKPQLVCLPKAQRAGKTATSYGARALPMLFFTITAYAYGHLPLPQIDGKYEIAKAHSS